ncbi:MAG: hypothetical protein ACU84Q_16425 [Gammaproteobacteria bacterium]
MKKLMNRDQVINGAKIAAVALIFQAVIATTPATTTALTLL